jgi:hypothetical protein
VTGDFRNESFPVYVFPELGDDKVFHGAAPYAICYQTIAKKELQVKCF